MVIAFVFNSIAGDGYKVGDKAIDFKLKNIDGSYVSLADYKKAKGFIVVFTCNHCPYSKAYEERIVALNTKFEKNGYPVIAINPNDPEDYPEDSFEEMKVRAKEKGFNFPYLVDETQEIAKTYGATRTPHVFILQKDKKEYRVAYIGAIDDNYKSAPDAQKTYVSDAVQSLIAGKEVKENFTKAVGCSIKWKEI